MLPIAPGRPVVALLLGALGWTACRSPDFGAPTQSTDWTAGPGFRWRALTVPQSEEAGFTAIPPGWSGVTFANALGREAMVENQMRTNGSGVALADVDGDGRVDVYFARLDGSNVLYRNLGDWRFQDVTAESGLAAEGEFSTGVTFADVDGDGDPDLVRSSIGDGKALYLNDGTGVFSRSAELGGRTGAMSLALSDIDGDGDLDLYITNYKAASVLDLFPPEARDFASTVRATEAGFEVTPEFERHYELLWRGNEVRRLELGEPDELYLNDGAGGFSAVPFGNGRFRDADGRPLDAAPLDWGLASMFADLNGDGAPDLYVANDLHSPDRVWLNDGSGSFRAIDPAALRTTSASTMAVGVSDVDRDGDVDVFTVDMLSRSSHLRKTQDPVARVERGLPGEVAGTRQVARNALHMRRADGTYAEVGRFAGVEASDWSWSVLFVDVDLDGYEDILISNGHILDLMDADTQLDLQRAFIGDWRETSLFFAPLPSSNVAFRNTGRSTFEEVGAEWGFGETPDISHGAALADLDGDGDLDVVVNRLDSPALLLRNDAPASRLAVRLRGDGGNRAGIGARIRVSAQGLPGQTKEITAGGEYLSSSEPLATFAMGAATAATIVVDWRDGRRSVVEVGGSNRLYEISQAAASPAAPPAVEAPAAGWFERVGEFSGFHDEPAFDDFERQPLLPNRLSQMGPAIAWHDLDGDGDPDLIVAAGAGSPPSLYRNDGGSLHRVALTGPELPVDQAGILPFPDGRGRARIVVGLSNYEAPETDRGAVPGAMALDLGIGAISGRVAFASIAGLIPGSESSTGALAAADIDLDGHLDLFVAGRVIPGRYPIAATSRLFRGRPDGTFGADVANQSLFEGIGLVTGALFSDLEPDGDADLVLSMEWGPVRVFRNDGGRFTEVTNELGLADHVSRWNAVTAADLDADGRPDLIATSWGTNTGVRPTREHPLMVYFEDVDRNGTLDVIEAQFDGRLGSIAPLNGFARMGAAIPALRGRLKTHARYADASVADVLDGAPATRLEATGLAHTVFWNRGGRFEAEPLPAEAQWSPSFGLAVADADGDGYDDVFLAQNFFATDEDSPRYDAGQGLWLRGGPEGELRVAGALESGIALLGDQRGVATADFDGDGRVDLAVGQNGSDVVLFRNVGGSRGLRVRLLGPAGNPYAIGASLRVVYEAGLGPRREIRSGSGTGSHDDPVQVLGLWGDPIALEVMWPGGAVQRVELEPGARDVTVPSPALRRSGS